MPALPALVPPWESARSLVVDYAVKKYGITAIEADPLVVATQIMLEESTPKDLKLKAAQTILRYTRPEVRSLNVEHSGKIDTGPSDQTIQSVQRLLSQLQDGKYRMGHDVVDGEIVKPEK